MLRAGAAGHDGTSGTMVRRHLKANAEQTNEAIISHHNIFCAASSRVEFHFDQIFRVGPRHSEGDDPSLGQVTAKPFDQILSEDGEAGDQSRLTAPYVGDITPGGSA